MQKPYYPPEDPEFEEQIHSLMKSSEDSPHLLNVSPYDDDPDINIILEQYNFSYILSHVKRMFHLLVKIVHPDVLHLELEDIAQEVHIHFWQKLQEEPIQNPEAYIARMIRNKCIDSIRRCTRCTEPQLLSMTDDKDVLEDRLLVELGEGMSDPADEFERKWAADNCMALAVDAVSILPPRQQRAMIHSLAERVDDFIQLVDTFKLRDIDISALAVWPDDEVEVHRLKASIAPARRAIAECMGVQLSAYKKRGVCKASLFCTLENESSFDETPLITVEE